MKVGDRVQICCVNQHWQELLGQCGHVSKILSRKEKHQDFIVILDNPVLGFKQINLYEDEVKFI